MAAASSYVNTYSTLYGDRVVVVALPAFEDARRTSWPVIMPILLGILTLLVELGESIRCTPRTRRLVFCVVIAL